MSYTNSIKNSEVEIIQNDYKHGTDQNKNEKSSNHDTKSRYSDNLNKTAEEFVHKDYRKKFDDKIDINTVKKDFVVYGYYVREPIWVNYETGGGGGGVSYDPESRNSFICVVFLLVFIMLVITAIWGALCMNIEILGDIYKKFGLFILIGASIVMIAMSYVMACSSCARRVPCNIICLFVAVIAMSLIVGYFTVKFDPVLVLIGVIATTVVVFVCFLLAFTSFDFTKWLLYVIVISVVIAVISLCVMTASLIMGESFPILHLIILGVSTLVHSVMLTMEIQMVLGGKSVELEEDDYALGAYMIYTSVVDLFIKLVQFFGILDSLFD